MNFSYIQVKKAGYINKVVLSRSGREIIMACEKGIFISQLEASQDRLLPPIKETYLEEQLVSQIFEYDNNMFIATAFHDA